MPDHRRNVRRFLNELAWVLYQWNIQPKMTIESLREDVESGGANQPTSREIREAVFAKTTASLTEEAMEPIGHCFTVKVRLKPAIRRIDDVGDILNNPSPSSKTVFGHTVFRKGLRFGGDMRGTDIMCEMFWSN